MRFAIGILAAVMAVQVLFGVSASALSNRGPDLADLGAGGNDVVGYVLVDEAAATIRTVQVPLYFTENTSTKSVTVHDANLCTDGLDTAPNNGGNYRDRNGSNYPTSRVVSTYAVAGGGSANANPSANNNCYASTKTINIPNSALSLDSAINMYKANFTAIIPAGVTNVQNHFYLTLNRADGIVGYSSSASANRFGMAQEYPQGKYKKYNLPFAPDCSVTSSRNVRVALYDDDNGTAGIQPKQFSMYIQEYTQAGAATQRLPLTITASQKQNIGNNTWIVESGNKQYAYANFTVRAGYKYRWVLDSIYSVNLLQFQMPFDSIYFERPCSTTVNRQSSITPTPIVEEGQTITGHYSIINNGPVAGSVDYTRYAWRDDNGNSSWDGAETRFLNDSGTANVPAGSTQNLSDWTDVASLAKHGSRVCVGITIKPANGTTKVTTQAWDIHCTSIGKKPKVQIWGGDLRARADVETSTGTLDKNGTPTTFGSWVEYGAFSVGTNKNFASGSGLNGGATNANQQAWSNLTFANVDASHAPQFGSYMLPPLTQLAGQFTSLKNAGAPQSNLGALASGAYHTGDLTITTSAIGDSKSVIIVATGTVTIQGDITYANGPFDSISKIPQVVIIANKINIANSAGHVDAWLLTTGNDGMINTCSDVALNAPLNSKVCNTKLTVNGPVSTQHLYLRRTAGADSNDSAELFNLRADAFLWAQRQASGTGKAQTVYQTELPPRF